MLKKHGRHLCPSQASVQQLLLEGLHGFIPDNPTQINISNDHRGEEWQMRQPLVPRPRVIVNSDVRGVHNWDVMQRGQGASGSNVV